MDKYSITFDDYMVEKLQNEEFAKGYLNHTFMNYIEDGNFDRFFKSLERVVKARMSIREFAKQAEMDRANLHAIFNGKKKPQFRTVLKILHKLGYTLRVA
jgi:probable addiction module antidote protein